MSNVKAVSKATEEVAKFGATTIKASEKLGAFVSLIIKKPCMELSGVLTDKIRFWRWKNLVVISEKVQTILNQRGITGTKAVLPKLAIPILENAGLENNEELRHLWSKLLANAMDPNYNEPIEYLYVDIIKNLRILDARVLHTLFAQLKIAPGFTGITDIKEYSAKKEQLLKVLNIDKYEYEFSMNNLMRLQCLTSAIYKSTAKLGAEPITIHKGTDAICFTILGWNFVKACIA